jgi:uncharacterized lipoprotein YajG
MQAFVNSLGHHKKEEVPYIMKKLLFFCMVIFLLSGCGVKQYSQSDTFEQDQNGMRLMTKGNVLQNNDNNVDYSTQNPLVDISNSPLHTNEDQEQIENVLEMEKGYWLGSMWINGKNAWITVYTSNKMTRAEMRKKEQQLQYQFKQALPRYDIHVNLQYKK